MPETGGDSNHVAAALRVKYTPTYPETPPVLNVRKVKGLDDDQVAELETLVRSEAENEELLGAAMVYMLAEKVQEWLLDRNEPELDMHAEMMKRHAAEAAAAAAHEEAAEAGGDEEGRQPLRNRKAKDAGPEGTWRADAASAGPARAVTLVTPESFAAWRVEYDAEQAAIAAEKAAAFGKQRNVDERCKLTGRQIFEQSDVSSLIFEDAGALQEGDEEDVMLLREDDPEEADDADEADEAAGAAEADGELLDGVGDEALFDEDEELPDE